MTDAERLFAEYLREHKTGGDADPGTYLARATPTERTELAAMIDAYLARAPRQAFDPKGAAGMSTERTVDELERVLTGQAGLWPALLPRLRDRAGLRRSELVEQLSDALGVGSQAEKVAAYYHEMEQGLLPAEGVTDRVLDALGRIVGENADALREAGQAVAKGMGPGRAESGAAFARRSHGDPLQPHVKEPTESSETPWDAVDWMFLGARGDQDDSGQG
jgi:hypothetical protein